MESGWTLAGNANGLAASVLQQDLDLRDVTAFPILSSTKSTKPASSPRQADWKEAICDMLWAIDRTIVCAVIDSSLDEEESHPLFGYSRSTGLDLDNEPLLSTIARRLAEVAPDDWYTSTQFASNGQERCLLQQEALGIEILDLAGALRMEQDIQAEAAWEADRARWADEEEEESRSLLMAMSLADTEAEAGYGASRSRVHIPSHLLGFRTLPPSSASASNGASMSRAARTVEPSLTLSARALLSSLECTCGAGLASPSHTRLCAEGLLAQAHAEATELRRRRMDKAREGAELARRFRKSGVPSAGAVHMEEARGLAVQEKAARQVGDLVSFWLHNPTSGVAMGGAHAGAGRDERLARERGEVVVRRGREVANASTLPSVDLHGLTVDGARLAVHSTLAAAVGQGHTHIQFITGRGRHSKGGHSTVKAAVGAHLRALLDSGDLIAASENSERKCVALVTGVHAIDNSAGFVVSLARVYE